MLSILTPHVMGITLRWKNLNHILEFDFLKNYSKELGVILRVWVSKWRLDTLLAKTLPYVLRSSHQRGFIVIGAWCLGFFSCFIPVFLSALQVSDKDVAKIVEMGFSAEVASSALKLNSGNVEQALNSLLSKPPSRESGSGRFSKQSKGGAPDKDREWGGERGEFIVTGGYWCCIYFDLFQD